MQSFLLKIFLSGMSVDVFIILVTENLRNTAVKQIEPYQATLGSGAWSYKERERERERERLKRSAHIAMQFLVFKVLRLLRTRTIFFVKDKGEGEKQN